MTDGILDYRAMLTTALRDVARQALLRVAEHGLPGRHHFYMTFRTEHPGVELPARLRRQYPEEMTVVVQNQFWELDVQQDLFSITLRFDGNPTALTIPFQALTRFVDPSVPFGLRFDLAQLQDRGEAEAEAEALEGATASSSESDRTIGPALATPQARGEILDFEKFRKP